MLVSDTQARSHLRIEGDEDISVYVGAAEQMAIEFLNRDVYASVEDLAQAVLDGVAGPDPMVVNDLIRAAILLTLGHLYANREDVVFGASAVELPIASQNLLQPYRKQMGV